jgi:hypothetical protein
MKTHFELAEWNAKGMHPVTKCILGSNNESVSQLQKVLSVEGHLWAQPSPRVDPSDLDKLSVNVIPDDLVQLLSGR